MPNTLLLWEQMVTSSVGEPKKFNTLLTHQYVAAGHALAPLWFAVLRARYNALKASDASPQRGKTLRPRRQNWRRAWLPGHGSLSRRPAGGQPLAPNDGELRLVHACVQESQRQQVMNAAREVPAVNAGHTGFDSAPQSRDEQVCYDRCWCTCCKRVRVMHA
jgi:hypothetical protein